MKFDKQTLIKTHEIGTSICLRNAEISKPSKLVEKFLFVHEKVNQLITIQKKYVNFSDETSRKVHLKQLFNNAKSNNIISKLDAEYSDKINDFGVFANSDIEKYEKIIEISVKEMITERDVLNSNLKDVILNEPFLLKMPNITLALFLMNELKNQKSRYKSYLKSLPRYPTSIMYITESDIKLLQHSQYLNDIVDLYCKMCCHYYFLFKLLEKYHQSTNCYVVNYFCFEDFCWAVSNVMTRNNEIPVPQENRKMLSLVPIWDMMNYKCGSITTDFDDDKECLIFYSMDDYKTGDEIYMGMGHRTTLEYFMFAGFVPERNEYDSFIIRIGFSTTDSLYKKKMEILTQLGIEESISTKFTIHYQDSNNNVISHNLRIYLTVMLLKEVNELDELLTAGDINSSFSMIQQKSFQDVNRFFKNRITMLLMNLKKKTQTNIVNETGEKDILNSASFRLVLHEISVLESILALI